MHEEVIDMFGKMIEEVIRNPDAAPEKVVVISLTEEEKNNILTPKRLELIRIIKKQKPGSVGELARIVDRRVDAVSRDLKILENYGFLELLQVGKQKRPIIEKEALLIPLRT